MPPLILICTVGGSHEPILTAIRQTAPDFVCFICSEPDPASGKPGSAVQITGKGNIIKKTPADEKPTLPNIPTQAHLPADGYELIQVSADDLGHAFARIRDALVALAQRFPQGRFLADYTGGTKTMTEDQQGQFLTLHHLSARIFSLHGTSAALGICWSHVSSDGTR